MQSTQSTGTQTESFSRPKEALAALNVLMEDLDVCINDLNDDALDPQPECIKQRPSSISTLINYPTDSFSKPETFFQVPRVNYLADAWLYSTHFSQSRYRRRKARSFHKHPIREYHYYPTESILDLYEVDPPRYNEPLPRSDSLLEIQYSEEGQEAQDGMPTSASSQETRIDSQEIEKLEQQCNASQDIDKLELQCNDSQDTDKLELPCNDSQDIDKLELQHNVTSGPSKAARLMGLSDDDLGKMKLFAFSVITRGAKATLKAQEILISKRFFIGKPKTRDIYLSASNTTLYGFASEHEDALPIIKVPLDSDYSIKKEGSKWLLEMTEASGSQIKLLFDNQEDITTLDRLMTPTSPLLEPLTPPSLDALELEQEKRISLGSLYHLLDTF